MRLERLLLEEFRRYRREEILLPARGLALHGENASGKSTIMEAIALLSTTRSPRTSTDRELIGWESGLPYGFPPYARIEGTVQRGAGSVELEIGIAADSAEATTARKQLKVNGRPVRATTMVGQLRSVLFTPEDVALISGPPSDRRRYLDLTLCQIDPGYMRALSTYGRVLTQRNSLLKRFQKDGVNPRAAVVASELRYWDDELVEHGSAIIAARSQAVARLSIVSAEEYNALDGGELALAYAPELGVNAIDPGRVAARDAAAFALREALEHRRTDEIRRGVTLSGPHRDDLVISIADRSAAAFASRGQQRLAVLALKLGEAALMADISGESPLVLLDDILSELDERHRGQVLERASSLNAQMLITSTDRSLLEGPIVRDLERRAVVEGTVVSHE
ncbi:MAG: DNA replication/repair protein RecF [Thermomicrobiales bacterium]|nr:DNA replication/repair protein RecF [Thermomicrobiales bacterium]